MIAEFAQGVRLLGRGWLVCVRTPRLWLLGLIPVLVTGAVFAAGLITLLFFLGDLATALTWFAADWPAAIRGPTRVLAAIALLGVAFVLGVVSFTAVTLTIGDPFYERISTRVEQRCGGPPVPESQLGFWRSFGQSLGDSARLVAIAATVGIGMFFAGFLPAVGEIVGPVLGAASAGWFLALELVGIPFSRRGLRLRDRREALRAHRMTALGFGVAVFGCFLVPGGAILVMPAAVVGGTLLARQALGLPVPADLGRSSQPGPVPV